MKYLKQFGYVKFNGSKGLVMKAWSDVKMLKLKVPLAIQVVTLTSTLDVHK